MGYRLINYFIEYNFYTKIFFNQKTSNMGETKSKGQGFNDVIISKLDNHKMEIVLTVSVSQDGETTVTVFKEIKKDEPSSGGNSDDGKK